ncbi:MAG: hypothetical protein JWM83_3110 [Candidatus Angelobacter sp.]|jgi:uncharacterized membrane-anchored protein YhcB (DUF1043 family)|nr:hypothetical protein [Candidatus Angelobacter sp.]
MTDPDAANKKEADWSNPELRSLLNQALAIEFVKATKQPETKTHWLQVLNSSTIAALITVILGTVLGSFLSSSIQEKSKKNDTELASYKEYLERERQVVEQVFQAIGSLEAASQNLIASTGEDFDSTKGTSKEKASVEGLKRQLLQEYNTADTHWHAQELQLGLAMDLEHQNDPAVMSAWQNVSSDMTSFSDCANRWLVTSPPLTTKTMQKEACKDSRSKLNQDLHALTLSIVAARAKAVAVIGNPGRQAHNQ